MSDCDVLEFDVSERSVPLDRRRLCSTATWAYHMARDRLVAKTPAPAHAYNALVLGEVLGEEPWGHFALPGGAV